MCDLGSVYASPGRRGVSDVRKGIGQKKIGGRREEAGRE